jgi:hypothetical protein
MRELATDPRGVCVYADAVENGDAIWAETTSGGLLRQLFGFYPTLHDAVVDSISFDRSEDSLTMDVDYSDGEPGETHFRVRMRLIWMGVLEVDISADDRYLYEVQFVRHGEFLETKMEGGYGIRGKIVSEGFEAVLDKVDPPDREETRQPLRIRYQ